MKKNQDIVVVPFKPAEGYIVKQTGIYSEQYLVKYLYLGEDIFWKRGEEIFCVENSRAAHQQVEEFAMEYLSSLKKIKSVKITSVTYC